MHVTSRPLVLCPTYWMFPAGITSVLSRSYGSTANVFCLNRRGARQHVRSGGTRGTWHSLLLHVEMSDSRSSGCRCRAPPLSGSSARSAHQRRVLREAAAAQRPRRVGRRAPFRGSCTSACPGGVTHHRSAAAPLRFAPRAEGPRCGSSGVFSRFPRHSGRDTPRHAHAQLPPGRSANAACVPRPARCPAAQAAEPFSQRCGARHVPCRDPSRRGARSEERRGCRAGAARPHGCGPRRDGHRCTQRTRCPVLSRCSGHHISEARARLIAYHV
ncbi:hypothetical protein PsYK624_094260 [Phanerochaete sordida]|uniref:Uncharacterized protein n=1 Tax=Phanerochaete sordida TaxID=48140 RepID=A0A9P3LGN2_9APHY|nr:hypothetical protein PsYK624_094260 [Phanerochaete sordida]